MNTYLVFMNETQSFIVVFAEPKGHTQVTTENSLTLCEFLGQLEI